MSDEEQSMLSPCHVTVLCGNTTEAVIPNCYYVIRFLLINGLFIR